MTLEFPEGEYLKGLVVMRKGLSGHTLSPAAA